MGRLSFTLADNRNYCIENDKQEIIGTIERIRVGAWMTWCLLLEKDCYMSAGCLDEVRAFIKKLNACSLNLNNTKNKEVDNGKTR